MDLRDRRLAQIVKKCQDIPGHELFQYIGDDGQRHAIGSAGVNEYLRSITGKDFTAKDFRTWAGTVLASLALQELEAFDSQAQAKKNLVQAIKSVSERLGNTPAICRKCYIHPTGDMRAQVREQIDEVEAFTRAHPRWAIARDAAQARALLEAGRQVLVLSLEGASGVLESEEDLVEFVDGRGIRIVTPLHMVDDRYGGAATLGGS